MRQHCSVLVARLVSPVESASDNHRKADTRSRAEARVFLFPPLWLAPLSSSSSGALSEPPRWGYASGWTTTKEPYPVHRSTLLLRDWSHPPDKGVESFAASRSCARSSSGGERARLDSVRQCCRLSACRGIRAAK